MKTLTEKALKEGKAFVFDNEEFQTAIKNDDIRSAEVSFHKAEHGFPDRFHVWFNGKLIHSAKTFKATQKRLNVLIDKWNLKLIEVND